ncbi:MAG: type II secretion system F family protein [Candidatus Marinimicrobia bacterium]|nr:type II secretion system F family protein [Candidatus Neomarinimicrobiota bacterium]
MPDFICRIMTDSGTVEERVITADSKMDVYTQADDRGEMLLSVKEFKASILKGGAIFKSGKKVKPSEVENFTVQLGIMFRSGIPLIGALEALEEQAETETMRTVVKGLIKAVSSGQSLSQAMEAYPGAYSLLYVNMIRAGESAGVMEQILERLGSFIKHDQEVTRNVKSALRYPMIVTSALGLAFIGAMIFIVPKFSTMFASKGIALPIPTVIMMTASNFLINFWPVVVGAFFAALFGFKAFAKTEKGRYSVDKFKLNAPVFKDIFLKTNIARFAHMLETLSKGGIQIIRALETVEQTVGNAVIGKEIANAREEVEKGVSLAVALGKSKYFPKMTIKMIAVGEKSGALDEMMANVAEQYDKEVDVKIEGLSGAIEPIMTVFMGGMLLFMALGIFLPMWNMYGAIK